MAGTTAMSSTTERVTSWFDANGGYPFMMLIAAGLVLVSVAIECSNNCSATGVTLVLVLSIIALAGSALFLFSRDSNSLSDGGILFATIFFFTIWAIIAGFGTFEGPFVTPSNGYFASWFGFLTSVGMLTQNVHLARNMGQNFLKQGTAVCVLIIGSSVVLAAGLFTFDTNQWQVLVAVIAGVVSLIFTVLYVIFIDSISARNASTFAHVMIAMWVSVSLLLTYSVFNVVGNGYFGCWGCAIASFMLARYI